MYTTEYEYNVKIMKQSKRSNLKLSECNSGSLVNSASVASGVGERSCRAALSDGERGERLVDRVRVEHTRLAGAAEAALAVQILFECAHGNAHVFGQKLWGRGNRCQVRVLCVFWDGGGR